MVRTVRHFAAMSDERVAEDKRRLRSKMRFVRARIGADPADRAARSARIWARIVATLDLGAERLGSGTVRAQIGRVMLYDSLPGEPDTSGWTAWCRGHGIEVFHPEVDGPELRVVPGDIDPATLDVVIVPGLAFTADGHRLGQGGGHFDRFLPRLDDSCVTIGVCFREQLVAELPTSGHDVLVDLVISDTS
jgi:5-formyltetrahydrofolate cyclo-ligase